MQLASRRMRVVAPVAFVGLLAVLGVALAPGGAGAQDESTLKQIARDRIKPAVVVATSGATRTERPAPSPSGGLISAALAALSDFSADEIRAEEAGGGSGPPAAAVGISPNTLGCRQRNADGNVRVNQDCTFRRQAEETITYNPAEPSNLVAGQNDSRVGFNQCGIDYSLDSGKQWGDLLPPFRQWLNDPASEEAGVGGDPNRNTILSGAGTFHTYDAASDPIVTVDSRGRAFFGCVVFDVASNASGLFVTGSPAPAEGSFFFNIGSTSRPYKVVEDNSPLVLHDKPFLAADRFASSPNRDNLYVTWTVFRFGANCLTGTDIAPAFCESPIFGSMSTDQGHTWSTPQEISGISDTLCFAGNFLEPTLNPHSCNFDQGSDPTVLPNGDVVVVFNNGNTPPGNPNAQQLSVRCHPTGSSTTGTAHLNCASPAKVGDDVIAGEPLCDFGRGPEECIPGAYIRTNDYPRDNKNVNGTTLYTTWQDYRNGEFDIQISRSTDGGLHWQELGTVNPDRGMDHYFPAVDAVPGGSSGSSVGVSYYRTERVPNENSTPEGGFKCPPGTTNTSATTCSGTGPKNSDYNLAGGNAHTPYAAKTISPRFAPPDGIQSGFNGDYSGLTITPDGQAHPIWSDTRNPNPFPENGVVHDEDVFTTSTGLP